MEFPKFPRRRARNALDKNGHSIPGASILMQRTVPRILPALLLLGSFLPGCDKNPLGTVETVGHAPFVAAATVTPDSVYLDGLTPVGGTYSFSVSVTAKVTHPDGPGAIGLVIANILRPGESDAAWQLVLLDDGASPDSVAGDGIYSGKGVLAVQRSESGTYRVQISATDLQGFQSNTADKRLRLTIRNAPPSLGSPSVRTYQPAGSDSVRFTFAIAASDSNGLETITSVVVQGRNTTDTSTHILFDDGLPSHGDAFPGDGIFSGILWLKPTMVPDSVGFVYTAVDDHGARASVTQNMGANQPPSFVSLNVPSTITRPASGSIPVFFFATVTDPDGLGDIDSVYFRNISSTSPSNILMYDDGDLAAHGDSVANDGTYSRIVSIASTNTPGTKEFHFTVVDKARFSATVIRFIVIN